MLDASKHAPSDIVGETEGSPPPDAEPDTEAATLKRPRVRRTKLSASEKEKPHDVLPPRPSFDPKLVEKSVWQHRVGASGSPVPPKDPKENIVSVIPDDSGSSSSSMVSVIADPQLPPAGMLDDMVSKLLVALHPHAQNSSIGLDGSKPGNSIEPTFGLYCPIEGANDVVDKTVRELATRVGADVIVLDAAQLAAGESGIYGEGSSA
ncbi:hypothetical protein FRB99_007219 [Tulasnella sp. 403]|nr:hypothetical protein FRB99_007219 [Tulasnella sp. 403]